MNKNCRALPPITTNLVASGKQPVKPSILKKLALGFVKVTTLDFIWEALANAITQSSQPQVWQNSDRQGQIFWYVYDPVTKHSAVLDSEDDVRVWFEQRQSAKVGLGNP